jgi:N-acetylglucosaminyldiphosphoundecaprenol N-acetyl-beta-D-mannosaminyltransferase
VSIDAIDFDAAVDSIVRLASGETTGSYVVTPNAHHVVLHQRDPLFRRIYREAFLVVADGVPLLWAARMLGNSLRGRVNGTDLFQALCGRAAQLGQRVYLLGGREGAADAARATLRERFPSLTVCGTYCPPVGFERDPIERAKILDLINAARPDILFVGLGAPKQEYWMYAHRDVLRVPVSVGIGVSFELVGGLVPRAPLWMQRSGLEWLFRLLAEPKRLWRRYLVGNAVFCMLVARQRLAQNREP